MFTVVDNDLAVYEDIVDACGREIGLFVSGAVLNCVVVENDGVGPKTFADYAAICKSQARCGPRSHFADGVFKSERVRFADVARDDAGKISVAARVREAQRVVATGSQRGSGVAADAGPGKFESGLNVLFAHHVIDGGDATGCALRDEVEGCVFR